jgi:hypothetical protein
MGTYNTYDEVEWIMAVSKELEQMAMIYRKKGLALSQSAD